MWSVVTLNDEIEEASTLNEDWKIYEQICSKKDKIFVRVNSYEIRHQRRLKVMLG